jgi:hypothetical protein
MVTKSLQLSAEEVIRLLRAEIEAEPGHHELNISVTKRYLIHNDHNASYGVTNGQDFDLVNSVAKISIEPTGENVCWTLEAVVERAVGPVETFTEDKFAFEELNLDEFEAELRIPGKKRIMLRLEALAPESRESFNHWLAAARARHLRGDMPTT